MTRRRYNRRLIEALKSRRKKRKKHPRKKRRQINHFRYIVYLGYIGTTSARVVTTNKPEIESIKRYYNIAFTRGPLERARCAASYSTHLHYGVTLNVHNIYIEAYTRILYTRRYV